MRELALRTVQPLQFMAETNHRTLNFWGDFTGWIPGLREADAALESFSRLARNYRKPRFDLGDVIVSGQRVAVTETVVADRPFCRLLHFRKDLPQRGSQVLLVAPLSGHYATLLRPTVEALLPGHDVFITDWADARQVPLDAGRFDLGTYVEYLKEFMRYLGPDTHVIAVCQPAVPVLCAVAHLAEDNERAQPRTMTLIAGPIDTRVNPTGVNRFARDRTLAWFESHVIEQVPPSYPGMGRRVYPGFLQLAGFVSMNMQRHIDAHVEFYCNLVKGNQDKAEFHRKFYDEYNAVLDMPAEYYLETIEKVFCEHHLSRGCMEAAGRPVHPGAIEKVALLTVEGGLDDITGCGQTEAAHSLCTGIPAERRSHIIAECTGHYGTFAGRKFKEIILPALEQFIRTYSVSPGLPSRAAALNRAPATTEKRHPLRRQIRSSE
ncbi:polyhydroxyalkanoate depolymerase [Paraburkholderia terricola]|jgi:poly(3-hydroxybutyrate) depolymerase|uniref:polyhydroxyalkanoate depolymerase n=1 Tax=Paraburkholderia terricola TaxID=169427 RepID=UPI00286A7E1F|nr:polyhydroxyalkanoate depolymerase [Paraburkholderia terricola]